VKPATGNAPVRPVIRLVALSVLGLAAVAGVGIELAASEDPVALLRYYTIQSNILVAAATTAEIAVLARRGRTGPAFARARMAAVLAIMVTGILYSLFLAGRWRPAGIQAVSNFLLHYFVPAAAFAVWLAFAEKGFLRMGHAPSWMAIPLLYTAYSLVQGEMTGFYPYWFVNPHAAPPEGLGSWGGLAAFVGAVCLGFFLVGAILVLADRALAKRPSLPASASRGAP